MKVLCIGHSSYDITLPVSEYPKENTKYRVDKKYECGGGPAGNAAYLLGKWGVTTYYQGMVGKDTFVEKILEEYKNVNVDTSLVEVSEEEDTTVSFILVNEKNGSRTLFNYAKKRPELKPVEYNIEPDIIHVDGHFYEASKKAFEKFPNAIKVIDAGRITDELLELCTMVDYLICSKGFAETVAKERFNYNDNNSLKSIFETLEEKFKCNIVVTLEEKGCLYKIDGKIKVMTGLKVEAKDTTGAGDIFHGAFIYGLSKQLPLEKCLKIANITAGLSVKKIGSRLSIPNVEEVYKVYDKNR